MNLPKGHKVIIDYCYPLKDYIEWFVLGNVTDRTYTIIDNHGGIYWEVDIKNLIYNI
jgi:hypothetical protein